MTDSQYENFHLYTPIMAHIWNTSTDSDTGISPFQAEHGIQARTPASSFWDTAPSKSSIATPEGLSAIAQSAHAFRKLLAQAKANRKAMVAAKLNSSGRSKVTYQVGDAVAFYLPPTQEQAEKANRKHKHLTQWAGPGYITKCLSANGTTFRIRCGNTNYERHVLNMRKWKGPAPPIPKGIIRDDSINVGSVVAVLDDDQDKHYHIAKVMDITDSITTLWYASTRGKHLRSAIWRWMYHDVSNGNKCVYKPPTNCMNPEDFRFTGTIPTHDVNSGLIIESNLQTSATSTGIRIGPVSVASLNVTQYKHHVINNTWKFPGNHITANANAGGP